MENYLICDTCQQEKHWRRFRLRVGNGTQKEVTTCSACRQKKASAASCKKIQTQKKLDRQLVLNRTNHEIKVANNYNYYFPELEAAIRSYAVKKTVMDRKYLRDHQHQPLSHHLHLAQKQRLAQQRAKGWVAFYDEICEHLINLLRQTGNRPSWAQMEGKADLQRLHGVYDTKRAQLLREKG